MKVMQVIWVGRIVRMEGDCEGGSNDGGGLDGWISEGDASDMVGKGNEDGELCGW